MSATTVHIPSDRTNAIVEIAGQRVELTNLQKPFWPERGYTKGDLLRYYATVAPVLLPHVKNRAMVMKRYPNGIHGEFFFMKRTPSYRPQWLATCSIEHDSGSIIDFPVVQDLASLLWVVNLGCIDLNPWYARCDDVNRPDYLHFDLDPVEQQPVSFSEVLEVALILRDTLLELGMSSYVKTTGSRGLHLYIPIRRGPTQKDVWRVAKVIAQRLAKRFPKRITAEYRVAKRPPGTVLIDYNQNAWGRTLAGVYSVRPRIDATVSAPVTWEEVERGITMEQFRLDNMPQRIAAVGDLWKPLNYLKRGRFALESLLAGC